MKKIGLFTFWESNYGSILQCYATKLILQKKGYICDLVVQNETNFISLLLLRLHYRLQRYYAYLCSPSSISELRKRMAAIKKQRKRDPNKAIDIMNSFARKELQPQIFTYRQLKKVAYSKNYIAFLSGSDQIWSCSNITLSVMSFLRFAPAEKRIAFAPSFGTNKIPSYNISRYRRYLKGYKYLSARETQGAELIHMLTGRCAETIIDPALQLSGDEWRNIIQEKGTSFKHENNYIVVLFLDNPNELALDTIKAINHQKGWKIISFLYRHAELEKLDGYNFVSIDPLEFVDIIDNASFVCTDSFHTMAFAMNLQVPFFTFHREYTNAYDQTSRITSILDMCRISDRYITNSTMITEENLQMDFSSTEIVLERERKKASLYLDNVLRDAEENNKRNK